MNRVRPRTDDDGTAVLEFVFLGLLMLVPLVYVLLTAFAVQRAAYALSAAAREAGRGYLTAPSAEVAEGRARAAVDVALRDHGLAADDVAVAIGCAADPCLTPGATVTVRLATTVPLPFVPALLGRPAAGIVVHADHTEVVDAYRAGRP